MRFINEFKDDLIEVYHNGNYSKFCVGYIIAEDEKYILLQTIHTMGFEDGKVLFLKEDISKIQKNTKYLKELSILMKENSKENILNSYIFKECDFKIEGNDNVSKLALHEAMNKKMLCLITNIFDNKSFGFVESIDDESVTLVYQDEITLIRRDEIKYIFIESLEQKKDYLIDMNRGI
ncbi:hypothetical protein [Streptobacillus ratti]|uniref:hypothetical protein n=1 Tax=Streptobacillus ratti TaxID=1720557 RepID=UPI0009328550|nr:hypothetical protein [Streptobacillus ratti]